MKAKILSLVLLLLVLFSLSGCEDEKYPPVESSREEAKVVMTLEYEGERYEIKYELYRALFLSNKSSVDGGDASVWSGEEKDRYISEINEIIVTRASEIYSAIHLAHKLGIDPYGEDVEKEIDDYIELSVEGNDADILGFGGDYDAYLSHLKANNMNYSVQRLLFRYSVLMKMINEYYFGYEDEVLGTIKGEYSYTEDDVRAFYFSDDSARVLHAYLQGSYLSDVEERMTRIRDSILDMSESRDVALYIINNTTVTPTDLIFGGEVSGVVIGRNSLGSTYSAYTDAAFSLSDGELSEVIKMSDAEESYYLVYKLGKDEGHLERCYDDIVASYLNSVVSDELYEICDRLSDSVSKTVGYEDVQHSDISMD